MSRQRETSPSDDTRLIKARNILRQNWKLFAGVVSAIAVLSTVVVGVHLSGGFKSVVRPAARAFRQVAAAVSAAAEGGVANESAPVQTFAPTGVHLGSPRVRPRPDAPIIRSSPAPGLVASEGPEAPAGPVDLVQPVELEALSTPAVADAVIYSDRDTDVQAPTLLSAGFPGPAILGAPTQTNTVELIVSARGSVERVRLLTSPHRMPDVMLLGSAKEWKFRPALKDDRPVRYRLVLGWEVNP